MSYNLGGYVQCETVQTMLDDQFKTCTNMENIPALEAILQGQAEAKISQTVTDNGKVKTVKVIYDQRLQESAVIAGSGARACASTTQTFDNYATYTIDPNIYLKAEESFTLEALNAVCYLDGQALIAKKIAKIADVLIRAVATQTANQLVASYGKYATTVTGVTADELVVSTLISTATKQLDDTAMVDIDLALRQTGYCGTPVIVGGSTLYKYGVRVNKGCCATTGVNILDMAREFGKAIAYDERVATALGSQNKSIIFQPGSVALLTYNTAPQIPNIGANYAKRIYFDPRTGLPIDIIMSDNCGVISILGFVNTKLVSLPTDMYAVGDKFRGVNFVNKISVTNPA